MFRETTSPAISYGSACKFYATQKPLNEIDFVNPSMRLNTRSMDWAAGFSMRLNHGADAATNLAPSRLESDDLRDGNEQLASVSGPVLFLYSLYPCIGCSFNISSK